jgi:hypothetical protein
VTPFSGRVILDALVNLIACLILQKFTSSINFGV